MNETVDPCEDFYEYACGNWKLHNPLPENGIIWDMISKGRVKAVKRVKEMVEEEPKPDDLFSLKLVKRAYRVCMNTDHIEESGLQPLVSTLWRIGGWPLIMEDDEWHEPTYKWQYVDDYYAHIIGLNSFYDITFGGAELWDDEETILIATPHLPKELYRLETADEIDIDSSYENNQEGPEGSQERDSEDRHHGDAVVTIEGEDADKMRFGIFEFPRETGKQRDRKKEGKLSHTDYGYDKYDTDNRYDDDTYDSESGDYDDNDEDRRGGGDYDDNDEDRRGGGDYDDNDEDRRGGGDYDDVEDNGNHEDNGDDKKERKKAIKSRLKYKEYIVDVAMALAKTRGVLIPRRKVEDDVIDLVQFQVELIKLVKRNGHPLRNIGLQEFQNAYDFLGPITSNGKINWIKKIQELFMSAGVELDSYTLFSVKNMNYIEDIRKLLDETPSKTIVNYIHWNFLSRTIQATTKEMRNLYHYWNNLDKIDNTRSTDCIEDIQALHIIGYEYVKHHFPDSIRQTASDMIDDIQTEVEYRIKESTWMDKHTRYFILDKLLYMTKVIGYPDVYRNATIMNNLLRGRYFKWEGLKRANGNTDLYWHEIDPLVANAYFSPNYNSIVLTAADFQSPFFDPRHPRYTNFGMMGFFMAHAINHGFDNTGRIYGMEGERVEWLDEMADEYDKRAECFEDQYTEYRIIENKAGNIPIEDFGKRTANDNIADSMGLQSVFGAYKRRQRTCRKPDPMLPGLENFSNEQLFFVSYANLWCGLRSPDAVESLLKDVHSPGLFRVNGPVSNSEDFAKAFNCPVDSPMNPKKKCNIWK